MVRFLSKFFGKRKNDSSADAETKVRETLQGIIERGGFQLDFDLEKEGETLSINFFGADSNLMTDREGQLLDGVQTFVLRTLQNHFPDTRFDVRVDCDGFIESSAQDLRDLAEHLKKHVLEKGGASYVRALPPRERKIVHRHLAEDARVKSQSIGDGFCKKIKITLARDNPRSPNRTRDNETFA